VIQLTVDKLILCALCVCGECSFFHFISPAFSAFYFLPVFLRALQKDATRAPKMNQD
jgi:hypothetical protein